MDVFQHPRHIQNLQITDQRLTQRREGITQAQLRSRKLLSSNIMDPLRIVNPSITGPLSFQVGCSKLGWIAAGAADPGMEALSAACRADMPADTIQFCSG
ncbi:hypothetical protein D3C73_1362010 [compost metagenome]